MIPELPEQKKRKPHDELLRDFLEGRDPTPLNSPSHRAPNLAGTLSGTLLYPPLLTLPPKILPGTSTGSAPTTQSHPSILVVLTGITFISLYLSGSHLMMLAKKTKKGSIKENKNFQWPFAFSRVQRNVILVFAVPSQSSSMWHSSK